MKKNIILGIIIALLVVAVAVEGFFLWKQNDDKNKEEGKGETEQVEQTPSPEPSLEPSSKPTELPKDETLDGENLKISKKYSNTKGNELVYTYLTVTVEGKGNYQAREKFEVPQINIESEDVEKINKSILNKYENLVSQMDEKQEIDFSCEGLKYKYYKNDGILSVVMVNPTEAGGYFNCNIYNIDISKGKKVENEKLLETLNITEKDLQDNIVKSINNLEMYKDNQLINGLSAEENQDFNNFVKEQKNKTIDKYKNEIANQMNIYINNRAHICAYMEVHAVAGGETTTILLDLKTGEIESWND